MGDFLLKRLLVPLVLFVVIAALGMLFLPQGEQRNIRTHSSLINIQLASELEHVWMVFDTSLLTSSAMAMDTPDQDQAQHPA
jgi:hypothetical protein